MVKAPAIRPSRQPMLSLGRAAAYQSEPARRVANAAGQRPARIGKQGRSKVEQAAEPVEAGEGPVISSQSVTEQGGVAGDRAKEICVADSHRYLGQDQQNHAPSSLKDNETRTYVIASRVAQGLPPRVSDPDALAAIQRALRAPHEPDTVRVEARTATHASRTDNDPVKKSA